MSKYTIYISLTVALVLSVIVSVFALPPLWWVRCTYCLDYPTVVWSISHYRPIFSGAIYPWQARYQWWRNFWSETFDIFTPEYCKEITVAPWIYDMFIPTRTLAEWNSFKNANLSRVTLNSCSGGSWCNISSGPVCWYTVPLWWVILVWSEYANFANECEAIAQGAHTTIILWVCVVNNNDI